MIRVHSYESMGTFDGPGLRLVVFLQGCNFRCLYCANPDTIDTKGESTETTIDEIVRMAVSQKAFFGKKGGVTFSGGEPTLQAKALIPLFQRLKEQSIHICIDTNGSIWNEEVKELLQWTDLVLLDIKEFNNVRHRQLTERSNEQTIRTAGWLEKNGKPFWLRYVLVPGYSSFEEDIRALGEHFKNYHMIQRVEILPYHTLGVHGTENNMGSRNQQAAQRPLQLLHCSTRSANCPKSPSGLFFPLNARRLAKNAKWRHAHLSPYRVDRLVIPRTTLQKSNSPEACAPARNTLPTHPFGRILARHY